MTIKGHPVYPGRPCPHSTGRGCDDYANRPKDPCIDFNCGWVVADSPLPEWMKPDKRQGDRDLQQDPVAWNCRWMLRCRSVGGYRHVR